MKRYVRYFLPKATRNFSLIIIGIMVLNGFPLGSQLIELGKESQGLMLALLTLYLFLAALTSYVEYHGIGPQDGVFRHGPSAPVVSLTFDDGPSPSNTPQILDILKEKGVKATFFLTGSYVELYPKIAKRIADEGHEIGNHTYTHLSMYFAKDKAVMDEIERTDEAIFKATGLRPKIFRPPRGFTRTKTRRSLIDRGYQVVLWSLSSLDWRGVKPKAILWRIKLFVRGGAIVLFHDNGSFIGCKPKKRENTIRALPEAIDFLFAEGYQLIKVSEMLGLFEEAALLPEA